MNPLGKVKTIVEALGTDITYAYEDLIFVEHNGFLLQFTESDQEILVHSNSEADQATVADDIKRLRQIASGQGIQVLNGDIYTVDEGPDQSIRLTFLNQEAGPDE